VYQENVSPPTQTFPETASAKNKAVHRPNIALSKQSKVTDSEPLPENKKKILRQTERLTFVPVSKPD
jgi:hypothetical protein